MMGIWKRHTGIYKEIAKVDECIRLALKSNQQVLASAVNDLLSAGGKRIRPAMVLLSGGFGINNNEEKLIPLAAAIEIMHMATLVHDDIIDRSDLRRGRPTVRNRWGNQIAVFTGDFLFVRAFSLITQSVSQDHMHALANTIKVICEGEIDQFQSRFKKTFSELQYLKRIARKTAVLFALSCQVGAMESQCDVDTVRNLKKFGYNFGMAFQITDDLLDLGGDPELAGKPLGSDFREGIYTLPVIYTIAHPLYKAQIEKFIGRDDLTDYDVLKVGRLVKESGSLEKSRNLALRYLERCHESLRRLPDKPEKDALRELLEETISRKY